MSLDVDVQFDKKTLRSMESVLSYKDRDLRKLNEWALRTLFHDVGYLTALRMRRALIENETPVFAVSVLLRQVPREGPPLHDTGKLADVLSFSVTEPGAQRTVLEVGPLGTTKSSEEVGLKTIDPDTPVEKLAIEPAETISYRELAWIHELGAVVPVTPAMINLFYALSFDMTAGAPGREGAAKMFYHLTGLNVWVVRQFAMSSGGQTVMEAITLLGGTLKSTITIPARPFMSPALKAMYGFLKREAPSVSRAVFMTWMAKTGERILEEDDGVLKSTIVGRGVVAKFLGAGMRVRSGGIKPKGFGVFGLAGFRPTSASRVRLGI